MDANLVGNCLHAGKSLDEVCGSLVCASDRAAREARFRGPASGPECRKETVATMNAVERLWIEDSKEKQDKYGTFLLSLFLEKEA